MTAHSSVERLKHWENFVNLMNESTSTQDSKPLPREEILQAKGKMYQMHKQKMKIQLENEQKALSPFSPAIQTNYESKEKVESRLIRYGLVAASKLEQKRKAKMNNEELFRPAPSPKPENRNLPERLLNMKKISDKKLEYQRIEQREKELKQNKSPTICRKSAEIAEKIPNRSEDVAERLQQSGKDYVQRLESRKKLEDITNKLNSVPKITPMAKSLNRHGSVTERLTRYQNYYSYRLQELNEKYNPSPDSSIQKSSNRASRERLLKPKSQPLSPEPPSFKPNLSQNSLKIAQKLENPSSRLLKSPASPLLSAEPECCFKPNINPNSYKLDNRKSSSGHRWESLYAMKDMLKEKKDKKVSELTFHDPECTFKPFVKKHYDKNEKSFVDRVSEWKENIDKKIVTQRERIMEDEIRCCTFEPDIKTLNLKKEGVVVKENKQVEGYSKKFKQLSATEFLSALGQLHMRLHNDD